MLLTVGLLLIYCVGDRPLSLWGTAFVDFDCEYAAELICGGPLTVFFDCWSSAGLFYGGLVTVFFLGDWRQLILTVGGGVCC